MEGQEGPSLGNPACAMEIRSLEMHREPPDISV